MASVQPIVRDADSFQQRDYSPAAKRALARKPALFVNNEWVSSSHGATLIVEDPSTGREVGRIVDASDADVDRAVAAARVAFDDGRWSDLPPKVRERTINKLADLIEAHTAEFAELEAIDNGKPIGFATMVDIPGAVDHLRYMAGWASKLGGEVIDPLGLPRGKVFSYVSRQPVGVAAQIIPWNFPLLMATLKISPALAAMLAGGSAATAFWKPRPSPDPQAHMGPLVSKEQMDRVMGYIQAGKRDGATVVAGGDTPAANGYYVNPTVMVNVKPSMSVVREEIFGPVLVAQRFDTLDEVAKAANETAYGLAASIWTKDVSAMLKLAARIKAGTVWGNCHAVIDPALPFGGFKQSGIGREQGREGIEAYTELKTVIIQL